jgi:hypothetical protein
MARPIRQQAKSARMAATIQSAQDKGLAATLVDPTPPRGATPVKGPSAAGFYNFETEGQTLEGTLVGTQSMPNNQGVDVDRWLLIPKGAQDPIILPNHWDLDQRLKNTIAEQAMPVRVWIAYRGIRAANTPAGYIKVYKVAILGKEAGSGDVPF